MNIETQIKNAYTTATNYPDLAAKLIAAGIHSYTVEVSSGAIIYRTVTGETQLHETTGNPRTVANDFSRELTIKAIRDNQQGKTDYPTFMDGIANAGVRFYEAMLASNKRVIYMGIGGHYEELIP